MVASEAAPAGEALPLPPVALAVGDAKLRATTAENVGAFGAVATERVPAGGGGGGGGACPATPDAGRLVAACPAPRGDSTGARWGEVIDGLAPSTAGPVASAAGARAL